MLVAFGLMLFIHLSSPLRVAEIEHPSSFLFQDESKMPADEISKREAMYKKHAFQEYVSELISPNR